MKEKRVGKGESGRKKERESGGNPGVKCVRKFVEMYKNQ